MSQPKEYRNAIFHIVQNVEPHDTLESEHQAEILSWINSGAPLIRIERPATPPKHLVVYAVLVDSSSRSILLVDHINAQKWLPPGGHVEGLELPYQTAKREIAEELGVLLSFATYSETSPLFLTSTPTVGLTAGHTDVDLWYVLECSAQRSLSYDVREFKAIQWLGFDEILAMDIETLDPHMHRFVRKLISRIESGAF